MWSRYQSLPSTSLRSNFFWNRWRWRIKAKSVLRREGDGCSPLNSSITTSRTLLSTFWSQRSNPCNISTSARLFPEESAPSEEQSFPSCLQRNWSDFFSTYRTMRRRGGGGGSKGLQWIRTNEQSLVDKLLQQQLLGEGTLVIKRYLTNRDLYTFGALWETAQHKTTCIRKTCSRN